MRRTSPIMTTFSLTRRQLARMALTGAAATLVPATVEAQNSENPTTTISLSPSEGAMLANAVPFNVGYALTEVQTRGSRGGTEGLSGGVFQSARLCLAGRCCGQPGWEPCLRRVPERGEVKMAGYLPAVFVHHGAGRGSAPTASLVGRIDRGIPDAGCRSSVRDLGAVAHLTRAQALVQAQEADKLLDQESRGARPRGLLTGFPGVQRTCSRR